MNIYRCIKFLENYALREIESETIMLQSKLIDKPHYVLHREALSYASLARMDIEMAIYMLKKCLENLELDESSNNNSLLQQLKKEDK